MCVKIAAMVRALFDKNLVHTIVGGCGSAKF
jgi:hypothetical protein